MELVVALELWLVMIAAPCALAWIVGDMRGAARMQKLLASRDPALARKQPPLFSASSLPVSAMHEAINAGAAPALLAAADEHVTARPSQSIAQPAAKEGMATGSGSLASSRRRKSTFDDLPCLTELNAQANRIRQDSRIWDDPETCQKLRDSDPIAERLLRHYQGSIDQMAYLNSDHPLCNEPSRACGADSGYDPPRLRITVPLPPRTCAEDLAKERREAEADYRISTSPFATN